MGIRQRCFLISHSVSMLSFLAKEKDRIEDRRTFANKVLLHTEVYYYMKLNDGTRLKILAEPLIQYLEDLLQDNPKDNIYFIMIQVRFWMYTK